MKHAKLALIPPLSLADDTAGDYYMYLPQLMANKSYAAFVDRTNSDSSYTMLDNGAFEGVSTDPRKLIKLAIQSNVNEVVIPDVLGDMKGTINAVEHFYHDTVELRLTTGVGLQYMAVPQGRTIDECMNCISAFDSYNFIGTIGLPKHLVRTVTRTARVQLAAYIRKAFGNRFNIHLLGASPLWPQEIKSARRYNIRGMDTSLPYFFSYYNRSIDQFNGMEEERPSDYFNLPASAFGGRLYDNIQTLQEWCND